MHYTRGLQEGEFPRYTKVVSTLKHSFDYDMEDSDGDNRFSFDAVVTDQDQ